jgi:hypothetical protein
MLEFRTIPKIPRIVPADARLLAQLGLIMDDLFDEVTADYKVMARLVHVVERLDRPTNRIDASVQNLDFAFNGPIASATDQIAMLDHEAFRRFAGPTRHVGLLAMSASLQVQAKDQVEREALVAQIREMVRQGNADFPPCAMTSSRAVAGITTDGWRMDLDRLQGATKPRVVLCQPGERTPRDHDMLAALEPLNDQLRDALLHEPDRYTMDPRAYAERAVAPAAPKRPKHSGRYCDELDLVPTPLIEAGLLSALRSLRK